MQQVATIGDLKQDILDALQGRTDISDSQIARYTTRAVVELTENYPFPELETTGPTVVLTIGQTIYPISTFLNTADEYAMAVSFALFVDFPGNTITTNLKYRTPTAIETMIAPAVTGIPAWFTRFSNNFHLGPVPQQPYSTFLRYQTKHPIDASPDLGDPIFIGRSWLDILAYSTALRIAIVKRWTDQRKELHDLLFGDPEYVVSEGKRGRPGLIAARLFQQERDERYSTRQVTITIGRYNSR